MTEAQLRSAWRHHTAARSGVDGLAAGLHGLEEGASAADRDAAARLMAEDARAADLGRALLALQSDSRALEAGFLAQRRARLTIRRLPRVVMAMAAMLALAAVIALPQWRQGAAPTPAMPAAPASDALIATSSFEAGPAVAAEDTDTLFRAGFDS